MLDGKAPITNEIARSLAKFFGVPISFWIRRESQYRKGLARLAKEGRGA